MIACLLWWTNAVLTLAGRGGGCLSVSQAVNNKTNSGTPPTSSLPEGGYAAHADPIDRQT
jgi:hypothetical protein